VRDGLQIKELRGEKKREENRGAVLTHKRKRKEVEEGNESERMQKKRFAYYSFLLSFSGQPLLQRVVGTTFPSSTRGTGCLQLDNCWILNKKKRRQKKLKSKDAITELALSAGHILTALCITSGFPRPSVAAQQRGGPIWGVGLVADSYNTRAHAPTHSRTHTR
jgi:hypothetical protein